MLQKLGGALGALGEICGALQLVIVVQRSVRLGRRAATDFSQSSMYTSAGVVDSP